jgi:hypothetical protein
MAAFEASIGMPRNRSTSTTMFWRIQQSFRTRDLSLAHPRVGTVSIGAEEILVDERLEQSSTDRGFDAAQPLHLHRSEAQTGHFEVFSPQPLKRSMIDYAIVGLWASHS